MDHHKIQGTLAHDGIKLNSDTPAPSHQGGIWGRLIRSVKSIPTSVLKKQILDDEGLLTIFCEVEAILKDIPITKVSNDPNDLEALTSNHILMLTANQSYHQDCLTKVTITLGKGGDNIDMCGKKFTYLKK